MKFAIGDKTYDAATLDELTLHDILLFEKQTEDMGKALTWADVLTWVGEIEQLKPKERGTHPGTLWITALTIWASRRIAGEQVTFGQAVDFPMKDLRWFPPTEDRKPGNQKARAARKGSARAEHSADAAKTPSPQTSAALSSVG